VGQALRTYPATQSASVTAWIRELLGCPISELTFNLSFCRECRGRIMVERDGI
jgi:hypothetical protein